MSAYLAVSEVEEILGIQSAKQANDMKGAHNKIPNRTYSSTDSSRFTLTTDTNRIFRGIRFNDHSTFRSTNRDISEIRSLVSVPTTEVT